jgi:hypothetical protein
MEEAENAVSVVGIVFRRVYPTLCRYAVSPARTVLTAESLNVITEFSKSSGS